MDGTSKNLKVERTESDGISEHLSSTGHIYIPRSLLSTYYLPLHETSSKRFQDFEYV